MQPRCRVGCYLALLVALLSQAVRAQGAAGAALQPFGRRLLDSGGLNGTGPNYCGGVGTQYQYCTAHRMLPGSVQSKSYCLVDVANDCAFADPSGHKNVDCQPCYLWQSGVSKCATPTGDDIASCKKGYIMRPDDCTKNVWKIWPTKKPFKGIEDMTDGKSPSAMNFLWQNLWASGLPGGVNPCTGTAGYQALHLNAKPFGAMLINAFAYRTQHTWHAHLGVATDDLRKAVDNYLVPAITKKATWTEVKYTWTTQAHGAVDSRLFGYLLGPVSANSIDKKTPTNIASLIAAAHKGKGPLATMNADEREFTGVAVTGATWGTKPQAYFMVVIYNYYNAWNNDPAHGKQIGEYELIQH